MTKKERIERQKMIVCMEYICRCINDEDVLDVVESMLSFASRHWMHDEGQNTEGFALRVKKAYLKEKDYWEGCIASLRKELAEAKKEKTNDISKEN